MKKLLSVFIILSFISISMGCITDINKKPAKIKSQEVSLYYFKKSEKTTSKSLDNIFSLHKAIIENGEITDEKSQTEIEKYSIISAIYDGKHQILKAVSSEGDIYTAKLNEKKVPIKVDKTDEVEFGEPVTFLNWNRDGDGFIYSMIMGDSFSDVRYYKMGGNPEGTNLLSFTHNLYNNGIEAIIFSAKFLPGSNNKKIIANGIVYDQNDIDRTYGTIFIYDIEKKKKVFEKKDYGVYGSMDFLYVQIADLKMPQFALSPDGKNAVYFANFRKTLKQKDRERKKEFSSLSREEKDNYYFKKKHKHLGAYLINLEDENEKPKLIIDNLTYTSWASWSPDGKHLVISGKLFKVEDDKFTYIPVKEKFAPEVLKNAVWSSNSKYFACSGNIGDYEGYVLYIPDKKVIKLPTGAYLPTWIE